MNCLKSFQRCLLPLAAPYAGLMHLRAQGYAKNWLRSWRPPGPAISVGNISWGGSGKTPLCEWLLQWCLDRKLSPLLLTRGYKARPQSHPYSVRPDSPVRQAGDEPLMLFRATGAHILVDPNRIRAGQWGWKHLAPDLFILDDGFQHLGVQRDLDLVLLRPADLYQGWNRVLPSGTWREGAGALKRASAFFINADPRTFKNLHPVVLRRLAALKKPIFSFHLQASGFLRVKDRIRRTQLPGTDCLLISGVANPQKIYTTAVQTLGKKPGAHLLFPDHHPYTPKDWQKIRDLAASRGGAPVLCTPKDSVKLEQFEADNLWTFDLELRFGPALLTDLDFPRWLEKRLSKIRI